MLKFLVKFDHELKGVERSEEDWFRKSVTVMSRIERELLLAKVSILGPEYVEEQLQGGPTHDPRRIHPSAAPSPAPVPAPLASLPGTSYRSVGHVLCLRLIRKLIPNFPAAAAISSWDLRRCVVAFALSFLSLPSHLHQYLRSPASPSSLPPALTNRALTL